MKLIENFLPPIIGVVIGYLIYKFDVATYSGSIEFIKQFTTIGTCTFGFLLTLFGLIVQSNSDVITEIRQRKIPYRRFIFYNRKVVFISLLLTLYSYIIGYLNIDSIISCDIILHIAISIFFGAFVWFMIETIYFLLIFYILIQDKDDSE